MNVLGTLREYFAGLHTPKLVKVWALPKGKDEQVAFTLRAMTALVVEGAWDADVRRLAHRLGAGQHSRLSFATAATEFVRSRVDFRFDPAEIELVRTPGAMARDILARRLVVGDCDDMAVLLAAMLFAQGIPVAFVTIASSPHEREFRHVFLAAKVLPPRASRLEADAGGWEYFDPTVAVPYNTDALRTAWWQIPFGSMPPRVPGR